MGTPTVDEVKAYREEHGVGMHDAKRILDARWREERLQAIRARLAGLGHEYSTRDELIEIVDILLESN